MLTARDAGIGLWKVQKKFFGQHLGRWLFYQDRVGAHGESLPARRLNRVNQWITERGVTAPWVMTRSECQAYWRTRTNGAEYATTDSNHPASYGAKSQDIVRFLHEFWGPHVTRHDRILELGCNCGANLNGLLTLGYERLNGVEINAHAVAYMPSIFPEVSAVSTITVGSVEDVLPGLESGSADVIFTMAVLIHVHPNSRAIFRHMVRVARKYVCVVELEAANCGYVFARDYRRVFEGLGCTEVASVAITGEAFPQSLGEYHGYTARLLAVPRPKLDRPRGDRA
ncbi:MAG TPA: class I SAM-dependent methyltransferase [Candidatus Acidoferrum sp.]|nr:class I SAM-dependent methyltransferase [Candidatus Acidoferrum sp.]